MSTTERVEFRPKAAKPDVLEGIVGFEELQRQLGFKSNGAIHNLIRRGCPSFRLGNRRMFVIEDVRQWILRQPHMADVRKPGRPRSKAMSEERRTPHA
jgi:hypothetical protein